MDSSFIASEFSEVFIKICEVAYRRGARSIKDQAGCHEFAIGDFQFAINPHAETIKCSKDMEILPYYCGIWALGWPVGQVCAYGGSIMGLDTEDRLIAALDKELSLTE